MTELRVTRPCDRCRHRLDCRPLLIDLRRDVADHNLKRPLAPDLEVVVDCVMYVPLKRGLR